MSAPRIGPLAFHAVTLATFLGAAAAPTPLYRLYGESFGLSPVAVTAVFAIYAGALLAALLVAGSVSDHLGRRPVIFGALLLEIAAMALFLRAEGSGHLLAARLVQGAATGIATASIGAALVDADRARGPLVNATAPLLGMGVGALGTSALVQYGPAPLHLVYGFLLVAFALQAVAIWITPETGGTRPGWVRSLLPRVAVPPAARRRLLLITPVNVSTWALGGFYLSVVPALVVSATGSRLPLVGGSVVAALMLSGAAAVLLRRGRPPEDNLAVGVPTLIAGIAIVLAGVHGGSVPVLGLGTLVSGVGFGANFLGSVGSLMPLAAPDERAGLLSAFYVQSYLAFSLPAVGAGYLTGAVGYERTADLYGAAIIACCILALAALRAERRGKGAPP